KKVYRDFHIQVRTPGHLTTNAFSPFPLNHRIYGCYSERYLEVLAELFRKMGFKKTLVFYAEIGMPEISNVGKTTIVEQNNEKIKKYTVTPDDLGVKEADIHAIKTGGLEQNIVDFIGILKGQNKDPKADQVAINT